MILVVDNYDSFTWNLVHYLVELGTQVRVERNDSLTATEALATGAEAFLISPGPGTPDEAGISLDLVAACAEARKPLLGICLGHQAIGRHFGGRVERCARAMHGKTSPITHSGTGLFAGLPDPLVIARYHSLAVTEATLPSSLAVTARSDDGVVMGLAHSDLPIHGVQFHPESIASEAGHALLANFLDLIRVEVAARA